MSNALTPEREHCPSCGFPLRGHRCEMCGGGPDARPLSDGRFSGPPRELEDPQLAPAYEALANKDLTHFVGYVVAIEGGASMRTVVSPVGPGWIATIGGATVFVALDPVEGQLSIQAPIARVPERHRVPVLRLALELSAERRATSRVCLREDLLVLRATASLATLTPPTLRWLLREAGQLAARFALNLVAGFDARPALTEAQRALATFDLLGQPRKLRFGPEVHRSTQVITERSALDAPTSVRASATTAKISRAPASAPLPPPSRTDMRWPEAPNAPASASAFSMRSREDAPPSYEYPPAPPESAFEELPPVLAPLFAMPAETPKAPIAAPAPPHQPLPQRPPQEERRREVRTVPEPRRRPTPSPISASTLAFPFSKPTGEIELDTPTRRPSRIGMPSTLETPTLPGERLAAFLMKAQSLSAMVLDARPATMTWLVRATVFRAIYEYRDELPDAVAHLYRCTGMGRDPAEPALQVIERVAVALGAVPKEKPLVIEPLSTAAHAKEHVARYMVEIERAPADPALRHFLSLGALTELLVRTRLSSQTEQRLRDIVAHGLREGSKSSAIDLMMTALERIAAG